MATVKFMGRQARLGMRVFAGTNAVPLTSVLDAFGIEGSWRRGTNVYAVYSPLQTVILEKNRLQINSLLPVKPKVIQTAERTMIEISGARLMPGTGLRLEGRTKIQQVADGTVRITLEQRSPSLSIPDSIEPNTTYSMDLSGIDAEPSVSTQPANPPKLNPSTAKPNPTPKPVAGKAADPIIVPSTQKNNGAGGTVQGDDVDENEVPAGMVTPPTNNTVIPSGPGQILLTRMNIADSGATTKVTFFAPGGYPNTPRIRRPDPSRIEIVFPNSTSRELPAPASDNVTSVSFRQEGIDAIVALDLERPLGAELSVAGSTLVLNLIRPAVGNGRLAGKIVVVDPGHGGHDTGAVGNGTREKDLTLLIGTRTAESLAAEGATVIMTRKSDVFISLSERANIANRNRADLFISIHINQTSATSTARGTITFYHGKNPIAQLLAECLQSEIKKTSELPSIGVWSDTRIYDSGFAVLRNTNMPGVLIECGFISNRNDVRRMIQSDFHQAISASIVRGLKVYLGDK
ncbi:MAG: N-acetylmuramoyl-L-alanine amidase [Armatimonadetes bacterium]|nr:N-acetylmuramoyl-L-alanine amidase [Armatimonadota bacterium]